MMRILEGENDCLFREIKHNFMAGICEGDRRSRLEFVVHRKEIAN